VSKIKHFIQQSWLLIISAFFFGLLIAIANAGWSPRIERNEEEKKYSRMRELIGDANDFKVAVENVEIPAKKGKVDKTDIYKALDSDKNIIAFAFVAEGPGFQDKIKLVIAVDRKCEKFFGFKVLSSNETPGFGSKIKESFFGEQFQGVPAGKMELVKTGEANTIDSEIVAITGATVSSEAVVKIFNKYTDKIKERLQTEGLIGNGK